MTDTNSELDRILQEFRLDVIDHFDTGTGNLQQTINEAKAAINQLLLKARIEGFLGAKVACSFDKNCKSCHANKLTLDYLIEPIVQEGTE